MPTAADQAPTPAVGRQNAGESSQQSGGELSRHYIDHAEAYATGDGLALCSLHHKVLDLGAFTILPDTYSLVFSQHAIAGEASRHMLMGFHGAGIILPQSKDCYPKADFLKWHEGQVFKRPGRSLT